MIAGKVSFVQIADNEVMPTLIKLLRYKIRQVCADDAYDTKDSHELLKRCGAEASIPARKMLHYRKMTPYGITLSWHKTPEIYQSGKKENQYYERFKADTAIYCHK